MKDLFSDSGILQENKPTWGTSAPALSEQALIDLENLFTYYIDRKDMAIYSNTSGAVGVDPIGTIGSITSTVYASDNPYTVSSAAGNQIDIGHATTTSSDYYWYVVDYNSPTNVTVKFTSAVPDYLSMDNCCQSENDTVTAARRLLWSGDRKELFDAGFVDKCGDPTDKGLRVFLERLVMDDENKTKLVAIAKEVNEEKKKKKDCK